MFPPAPPLQEPYPERKCRFKNVQRSRVPWAKRCSSGRPTIPRSQRLVRECCYRQSDLCRYLSPLIPRLLTQDCVGVTSTVRAVRGLGFKPFLASLFTIVNVAPIVYRGHEKGTRSGYIIGHEFTGTVLSVGSGVKNFKSGDQVVSPFTRYGSVRMQGSNYQFLWEMFLLFEGVDLSM